LGRCRRIAELMRMNHKAQKADTEFARRAAQLLARGV
jgi:hypothetical protein